MPETDQLTQLRRGDLNGTHDGFTGGVGWQEDWSLDPTGNAGSTCSIAGA